MNSSSLPRVSHKNIIALVCTLVVSSPLWARGATPVLHWSFDRVEDANVPESVTGSGDAVTGKFRLIDGVRGKAIVMDGYTTCIHRKAERVPNLGRGFTIEAWIALGAYPWNWAPIAAQENTVSTNSNRDALSWPDDIVADSPRDGFFFGVGSQGDLGLHLGADGWRVCKTERSIPLRTWTHVAASYAPERGIVLFINGEQAARLDSESGFSVAAAEDLTMGMARQKIEPSHPVRAFATLPCWYALDGVLDELKIYDTCLADKAIAENSKSPKPASAPALPRRVMPSGPPGPGKFGASYVNLSYYPEWDALWRVSFRSGHRGPVRRFADTSRLLARDTVRSCLGHGKRPVDGGPEHRELQWPGWLHRTYAGPSLPILPRADH